MTARAVGIAAVIAATAVLSTSCAAASSVPQANSPTSTRGVGSVTAQAVFNSLRRHGLAVPNPVNTTAQECPAAGCFQSIVTDTVRIKSFATAAQAQRFAADRDLFQLKTIVLTFAPPLTAAERASYRVEMQRLM